MLMLISLVTCLKLMSLPSLLNSNNVGYHLTFGTRAVCEQRAFIGDLLVL